MLVSEVVASGRTCWAGVVLSANFDILPSLVWEANTEKSRLKEFTVVTAGPQMMFCSMPLKQNHLKRKDNSLVCCLCGIFIFLWVIWLLPIPPKMWVWLISISKLFPCRLYVALVPDRCPSCALNYQDRNPDCPIWTRTSQLEKKNEWMNTNDHLTLEVI